MKMDCGSIVTPPQLLPYLATNMHSLVQIEVGMMVYIV